MRLPTPIRMELTSFLQRGNRHVEALRSEFLLNSLSVAIRPRRAVPRMVSHPPKCRGGQRPRTPRLAPQTDPQRQPSRKLGSSCTKRISQRSRQSVPGILNLQEGEVITQQVLDSSPAFHLRWAANEARPPAVIGEHWIDHLDAEGHIAKCKPHDLKFEDVWLPLYTRAGITRHVSGLSSLLKTQGDSPLIAVIPPDMLFQSDREYVIHKLHEEDSLSRVTFYYGQNL